MQYTYTIHLHNMPMWYAYAIHLCNTPTQYTYTICLCNTPMHHTKTIHILQKSMVNFMQPWFPPSSQQWSTSLKAAIRTKLFETCHVCQHTKRQWQSQTILQFLCFLIHVLLVYKWCTIAAFFWFYIPCYILGCKFFIFYHLFCKWQNQQFFLPWENWPQMLESMPRGYGCHIREACFQTILQCHTLKTVPTHCFFVRTWTWAKAVSRM